MKLNGRVALVTGASRGIGRAVALELAKEGAIVAVNYRKDRDGCKKTIELIKAMGGFCIGVQGDVSKYEDVKRITEIIMSSYGKIDILVNNAGKSYRGLFIDMPIDDINNILDTDLKGIINTCRCIVPYMASNNKGVIVNISSIWGNVGGSCEAVYSAAKGAVNSFTKALGKEMGLSGIRVNAVAPGVIDTEMNGWMDKDERNELAESIAMGTFGQGEDIAKAVAFLCSDDSKYITSQIITVDGGMY